MSILALCAGKEFLVRPSQKKVDDYEELKSQFIVSKNILLATLTVSNRHSWEQWIIFLSQKKPNGETEEGTVYHVISTACGGECLRQMRGVRDPWLRSPGVCLLSVGIYRRVRQNS